MKRYFIILILSILLISSLFSDTIKGVEKTYKQWPYSSPDKYYFSTTIYIDNLALTHGMLLTKKDDFTYSVFDRGHEYPSFYADTGTFSIEDVCSEYLSEKEIEIDSDVFYKQLAEGFREYYLNSYQDTSQFERFSRVIDSFTMAQLRILRNTIYANRGYQFKSEDLISLFGETSWYSIDTGFSELLFDDYEKSYLELIKSKEN